MGDAMKGVTKAMGQMNRRMNLPSLQKIMQEFERQNEKMELVSEVMGDAIDDALEGDEEEEETEDLVNQVLDEIGIDINSEVRCFHSYYYKKKVNNRGLVWVNSLINHLTHKCLCISYFYSKR
jgi:division protein CdvB (Snf7/Vps24/ESCRT-III family)